MNDCPTEGWYLCTNMHDDWFGEGQSMYLSFLLHAQLKKQTNQTVCLYWISFSFQHKQTRCCTFKNGPHSRLIFIPSHFRVRLNVCGYKKSVICSTQDGPTVVFLPSYQNTWICNIYNIFKVFTFNCGMVSCSLMV